MSWRDIDLNRLFTLDVDRKRECMRTSYSSGVLFMMMAEAFEYKSFLEIGTWAGYVSTVMARYFELSGGGLVHTVDPFKRNTINEQEWRKAKVRYFEMTSDNYFAQLGDEVKFDMIFIDGDHKLAGEDFKHSLPHLSKFGTIVFHDLISIGTIAEFLYENLSKRGDFELLSLPFHTGYGFVRRRDDWKKVYRGDLHGHRPKGWLDLTG